MSKINLDVRRVQTEALQRKTILEAKKVNVFYGEKHAIKDVSLSLPEKTVTAFIGPSACGKSTFLRCLNRMNDTIPTAKVTGEILIEQVNVNSNKVNVTNLRRQVGMVFQRPNPFAKSIYDNITFAPKIYGESKIAQQQLVEESLKRVGLWDEVKDRLHKSAFDLSGGQQQRLCIARTIAMKPKIILLDEPTSALDPISTAKIEELVQELKKEFTIAIVTHNMQQAARISDITAFFLLGNLIEMNHTAQLFTNPAKEETENYLTGRFG